MITSASPSVHRSWSILCEGRSGVDVADEKLLFSDLEDQVLKWMGDPNYTCEVFHVPFHTAHLADGLFVVPSTLFPLLEDDVRRAHELWRRRNRTGEYVHQKIV